MRDQERRGNGWIRKPDMIVSSVFFILNWPISQKSRSVKAELLVQIWFGIGDLFTSWPRASTTGLSGNA